MLILTIYRTYFIRRWQKVLTFAQKWYGYEDWHIPVWRTKGWFAYYSLTWPIAYSADWSASGFGPFHINSKARHWRVGYCLMRERQFAYCALQLAQTLAGRVLPHAGEAVRILCSTASPVVGGSGTNNAGEFKGVTSFIYRQKNLLFYEGWWWLVCRGSLWRCV